MLMRFLRAIVFGVLLLVPAACATGSGDGRGFLASIGDRTAEDDAALTPAERRLREDNRVFNETILGGAATGAVQGALLGALIGLATGDFDTMLTGMAIGAGTGAVAGGFDGWRVAVRQEAARKRVREIELITDQVEAENQRIQQSIDNMDLVIADTQRSLRGARAGYRSQTVSLEELEEREARAERNIEQIDALIESMEKRNVEYAEIADELRSEGQDTRQIDFEIAETRALLNQKKRERDLLEQELEQGVIS